MELPVAFQGERGAYSEEAAIRLLGEVDLLPCRTLRQVFAAMTEGRAGRAVVPVENSRTGSIIESYDLLVESDLSITAETVIEVRHCLLALPGQRLEDVRQVLSHPQALAQCEEFIAGLGAEAVAVHDTAGGARLVREQERTGTAAIAGERAAALYGLDVLARGIQTSPDNMTRFYLLAPGGGAGAAPPPAARNRTALVVALREDNAAGALFWCLATLAYWQVNLLKIESRPSREKPWHYYFHLDLDAHVSETACRAALEELRPKTTLLRVLGSFPRVEAAG
jgi:prephenate dehydratase